LGPRLTAAVSRLILPAAFSVFSEPFADCE
jgi:hypothetical protein